MLINYFSPVAPAATLLLGALILFGISPRRPVFRQPLIVFLAPVILGITAAILLTTRLTLGVDDSGAGLQVVSGWSFFAAQSGAALAVRLDLLSLLFIILITLILLAIVARRSILLWNGGQVHFPNTASQQSQTADWFVLAAGAALFFVAANGLTLSYALVIFDALLAFFWWKRHRLDYGIAGLFLAFFIVTGLILQSVQADFGQIIFYAALWLRLGMYPIWGWAYQQRQSQTDYFFYLLFSVPVGIYLFFRTSTPTVPTILSWLILFSMIVTGLWGALTTNRQRWLVGVTVVESLALLLFHPLEQQAATAWVVGLLLSIAALWHMPRLGQPNFSERAWLWPYLPAAGATLTLLGLPLTLAGAGRSLMYPALADSGNGAAALLVVVLSESLVLSGLVGFWREIWQTNDAPCWGYSVAGVVLMVPFLIPGLGTFIFTSVTGQALAPNFFALDWLTGWGALTLVIALAVGCFAPQIRNWLGTVVEAIMPEADFSLVKGLDWLENSLSRIGKIALRIEAWLEGQHYLGWALLVAIIGMIIFFLGT